MTDKYLRELPLNPLTGKHDSWRILAADEGGVGDVLCGAQGKGLDGSRYADW